jgi:hypothetical protein
MSTEAALPPFSDALPPDIRADLEAVTAALAAGKKPDPELSRRIRDRARKATDAIRHRCGELNIAVDLIRQTRDEA